MTRPRWLDDVGRDIRHAVRGLRRSPGLSATVVVVLALGIGANTAMFGIVHGMLLRPPPYPHGERIVRLGREPRGMPGAPVYLSAREIERLQGAAGPFEEVAAYGGFTFEWVSPDGSRPWGAPVSPSLLRLLGATPTLGRLFTDGEARPGADGVVLLSHRAWVRRFGADPEVVGTVVDVHDERRTVVGVLAEGFSFPTPGRRSGRPTCCGRTSRPPSCWADCGRESRPGKRRPSSAPSWRPWTAAPGAGRGPGTQACRMKGRGRSG